MSNWQQDDDKTMRQRERSAAHEARKTWTKGQHRRVNVIGCFMFLFVAACIGALVVFFINNPNGIPR